MFNCFFVFAAYSGFGGFVFLAATVLGLSVRSRALGLDLRVLDDCRAVTFWQSWCFCYKVAFWVWGSDCRALFFFSIGAKPHEFILDTGSMPKHSGLSVLD